jgi:hypothetical protein
VGEKATLKVGPTGHACGKVVKYQIELKEFYGVFVSSTIFEHAACSAGWWLMAGAGLF